MLFSPCVDVLTPVTIPFKKPVNALAVPTPATVNPPIEAVTAAPTVAPNPARAVVLIPRIWSA